MRLLPLLRFHPAIAALLLATGLSIAACRDGGHATSPDPNRESASAPKISAVRLINGVPMAGETIQLNATATNLVTRWNWDFGTGATPQESQDAEPVEQLLAVGRHTGQVWATNGFGTSEPFVFPYSIAPATAPSVGSIFPQGRWMSAGSLTRFSLPILPAGGLPSQFQWTATGGIFEGPTNNSIVAFRANLPGLFNGSVIASNAYGADESTTEFTILEPPRVGSVEENQTRDLSQGVHALTVNMDIPFTSPYSRVLKWEFPEPMSLKRTQQVRYDPDGVGLTIQTNAATQLKGTVRACEYGWNCSQPQPFQLMVGPTIQPPAMVQSVIVPEASKLISYSSLALLDDIPIVLFDTRGEAGERVKIFFAQADSPNPASDTGWTSYEVFPDPDRFRYSEARLTTRHGRPFFVYVNQTGKIVLAEATSARPSTASEWEQAEVDQFLERGIRRAVMVSSEGAIWGCVAEEPEITFRRLGAQEPIDSAAWHIHTLDDSFRIDAPLLAEFEGKPVIAAGESGSISGDLAIFASTIADPTGSADWINYTLDLSPGTFYRPGLVEFRSFNDRMVILYSQRTDSLWLYDYQSTTSPLLGREAWSAIAGATVSESHSYVAPSVNEWQGRLVEIGGIDAWPDVDALTVARAQLSSPATRQDWHVAGFPRDLFPALRGASAASATHLYILGIQGKTTPTLFWTTDDF